MTDTFLQVHRTFVRWQNKTYSYFGGCDYFRLALNRKITAAVRKGMRLYGLNVAASRSTTGNNPIYEKAEAAFAEFFDIPAATVVPTGYAAPSIVAQALHDAFTRVLIDEKAHASLRDASRQFSCPVESFPHRDPASLAALLARGGPRDKPIILTDGIFSHSGEVVPLAHYLQCLPARGMILLDDAHGAGVLGENGRGTPEYSGVPRDRIIQTISLSKAFGSFGGVILGSLELRDKIRVCPMFAGGTPLPPPLAAGAMESLVVMRGEPGLRHRLERNCQHVRTELRQQGFPVSVAPTPIIVFYPSTPAESAALRDRLLSRKILPTFIDYAGGPEQSYFRFALSSEHTPAQLDDLLNALMTD
jgi:7-keto-8-aminopelargonate synthetase-like enzyme